MTWRTAYCRQCGIGFWWKARTRLGAKLGYFRHVWRRHIVAGPSWNRDPR